MLIQKIKHKIRKTKILVKRLKKHIFGNKTESFTLIFLISCVCLCVCVCVHACVLIYLCLYVHLWACTLFYVYAYINMYISVCVNTYIHFLEGRTQHTELLWGVFHCFASLIVLCHLPGWNYIIDACLGRFHALGRGNHCKNQTSKSIINKLYGLACL